MHDWSSSATATSPIIRGADSIASDRYGPTPIHTFSVVRFDGFIEIRLLDARTEML